MLQNAGAIGLNASTSHDNTRFFVSLPTNALELWFALESERFQVCLRGKSSSAMLEPESAVMPPEAGGHITWAFLHID